MKQWGGPVAMVGTVFLATVALVYAVEQLDLTAPITAPSVTFYKVQSLTLTVNPPVIDWTVVDNNGVTTSGAYNGTTAATLLGQLNRGNFSVNSLQKQIILRLQADGYLGAGTVGGTP